MTTDAKPIHPGEVLFEVYMKPAAPPLTVEMLSQTLRMPLPYVKALINGQRAVTPSLALRLGVICRTTAEYWLALQRTYDAEVRQTKRAARDMDKRIRHGHSAAA
jgi:antitoxin HigA-1